MASVDDLSRSEYPAMLANLQPGQAVQVLSDRVRRIARTNQEIADWLQERRRVEEQYVAALRKLLVFKVPNSASELGIFQAPWDKILQSTDGIAASHQLFAQRIEKDVEQPLRNFQGKREMQNIQTISANLQTMARELDDATEKSEKLSRKGGKASAQKVDQAAARLESATQQWESQGPFIFETLQALDEQRVNHLRDVLTQFETHEVDQATRTQAAAEEVLNVMLEVDTSQEIRNFVQRTTSGKPKLEKRPTTRQQTSVTPSPAPPSITGDDVSEHSGHRDVPSESKLRSRIGTMLGRRRQSVHGGFGQLGVAQKSLGPFSRGLGSSHSQTLSPRSSSHNLADSQHRLPSVVESPTGDRDHRDSTAEKENGDASHEGTNGVDAPESSKDAQPAKSLLNGTAEDIFDAPAGPSAPQSQQRQGSEAPSKDAEGFTIPPAMDDPISQAQREAAAEDGDQLFRLNIKNEPIPEEDQDAKQAALSSVANALTTMGMPSRKAGTVRGRREVRNTVYMPALPTHDISTENPFPPSPSLPTSATVPRPTPSATFASETSHASDTQSIRSGTSFGGASSYGGITRLKHPDMHGPAYGPGLHSSIIETVSAVFQDGEPASVKVTGEIALAYNPDPNSPQPEQETIRLNHFSLLESIGPNRVLVSNTAAPDEFALDLSHLTTPNTASATPAFTYRVHADAETSLAPRYCPIAIHPVWKPQADKLGLLLQYRLNPSFVTPSGAGGAVTLSNVVFIATYDGARASGVQTKPAGTHLKEKHVVYWRLGDVTLSPGGEWSKIICRVIGEQNAEPRPGRVEVRWEWASPAGIATPSVAAGGGVEAAAGSGISVARLVHEGKGKGKKMEEEEGEGEEQDPFADVRSASPASPDPRGRTWADVPLVRRLVSGRYESK